jgi:hypothetical protein
VSPLVVFVTACVRSLTGEPIRPFNDYSSAAVHTAMMKMRRCGFERCLLLVGVESNVAFIITATAIDNETLHHCAHA